MALDPPTAPGGSGGAYTGDGSGGVIGLFARHGTAPNLLMLMLILIGAFSLTRLNRQFFPNFEVPVISVSVSWTPKTPS